MLNNISLAATVVFLRWSWDVVGIFSTCSYSHAQNAKSWWHSFLASSWRFLLVAVLLIPNLFQPPISPAVSLLSPVAYSIFWAEVTVSAVHAWQCKLHRACFHCCPPQRQPSALLGTDWPCSEAALLLFTPIYVFCKIKQNQMMSFWATVSICKSDITWSVSQCLWAQTRPLCFPGPISHPVCPYKLSVAVAARGSSSYFFFLIWFS